MDSEVLEKADDAETESSHGGKREQAQPDDSTTFDTSSIEPTNPSSPQSADANDADESVNDDSRDETANSDAHVDELETEEEATHQQTEPDSLQASQYEKVDVPHDAEKDYTTSMYASSIASQFEELDVSAAHENEKAKSQVDTTSELAGHHEPLNNSNDSHVNGDHETENTDDQAVANATETLSLSAGIDKDANDDEKANKEKSSGVKKNDEVDSSWLDVLGDGSLRKRTLRRGDGRHTRPLHGQICKVQFSVWPCTEDDMKGDEPTGHESEAINTLTLPLGESEFCNVFELCVSLMEAHEISDVIAGRRHWATDPAHNLPSVISSIRPPPVALRFRVELANVEPKSDYSTMSVREVCKIADRKRELGNACYAADEQSVAIAHYRNAIGAIEESEQGGSSASGDASDADRATRVDLKLKCWANLAAAQLKLKVYDECVRSCNEVLRLQPDNVKVLQRKAKALQEKQQHEEALVCYKRALALDPSSRFVQAEVTRLEQRIRDANERERTLYKRMFSSPEAVEAEKRKRNAGKKTAAAAAAKSGASSRWPFLTTTSLIASSACVLVAFAAFAVFKQYSNK